MYNYFMNYWNWFSQVQLCSRLSPLSAYQWSMLSLEAARVGEVEGDARVLLGLPDVFSAVVLKITPLHPYAAALSFKPMMTCYSHLPSLTAVMKWTHASHKFGLSSIVMKRKYSDYFLSLQYKLWEITRSAHNVFCVGKCLVMSLSKRTS